MLIRYHYGNFGKLTELLFYLNEGKACKYLLQFVFPRIGSYTVHSKEFPIAGIRMPEKALPVMSAGSENWFRLRSLRKEKGWDHHIRLW